MAMFINGVMVNRCVSDIITGLINGDISVKFSNTDDNNNDYILTNHNKTGYNIITNNYTIVAYNKTIAANFITDTFLSIAGLYDDIIIGG